MEILRAIFIWIFLFIPLVLPPLIAFEVLFIVIRLVLKKSVRNQIYVLIGSILILALYFLPQLLES